jgi:hypothetical protein
MHLYECSVCGSSVDVIGQGDGVEPIKNFLCGHDTAMIYANRSVVLRGKGDGMASATASTTIRTTLNALLGLLLGNK